MFSFLGIQFKNKRSKHLQYPKIKDINTSKHTTNQLQVNTDTIIACFGVTFMNSMDPLKVIANENTARTFHLLSSHVLSFLIITENTNSHNIDIWLSNNNNNVLLLNKTETNVHNTPKFKSIITQLEKNCPAHIPFVAYSNADILFDINLVFTLQSIKLWIDNSEETHIPLLIAGKRSNYHINTTFKITSLNQIKYLNADLFIDNRQDYFILTRNLVDWSTIPDYVIGRRPYDNALNDWAFHRNCLLDATHTILALHQTTADGNLADHKPNPDKKYNVDLQLTTYDHDMMSYAQYYTAYDEYKHDIVVFNKNTNEKLWPNYIENLQIRDSITKKHIYFKDLNNPIFLLTVNKGYSDIASNFLCNMLMFPNSFRNLLILSTHEETRRHLEQLTLSSGLSFASGIMSTSFLEMNEGASDYDSHAYNMFMYERGKTLVSLIGTKDILWLEPDATYYSDLMGQEEIAKGIPYIDIIFYWDAKLYGGGFIRFSANQKAKQFYQRVVHAMESSRLEKNDQVILQDIIQSENINYTVFDTCKYRHGLFLNKNSKYEYISKCEKVSPIVQQHNWVIGKENKISLAKEINAWFLQIKDEDWTCTKLHNISIK
jgi:hypothetical protein